MIFKWIKSGASKTNNNVISIQADGKDRKRRGDSKLIDVAYEAMSREQKELDHLVKTGWPVAHRKKFKSKVKQKVWDTVSQSFDPVDDDMVEEITERVVEASEADPFYKKIFNGE